MERSRSLTKMLACARRRGARQTSLLESVVGCIKSSFEVNPGCGAGGSGTERADFAAVMAAAPDPSPAAAGRAGVGEGPDERRAKAPKPGGEPVAEQAGAVRPLLHGFA